MESPVSAANFKMFHLFLLFVLSPSIFLVLHISGWILNTDKRISDGKSTSVVN